MKKNSGFLTDLIDREEYYDYVNYIENITISSSDDKKIVKIDELSTKKTSIFKKNSIKQLYYDVEDSEDSESSDVIDEDDEDNEQNIMESDEKKIQKKIIEVDKKKIDINIKK